MKRCMTCRAMNRNETTTANGISVKLAKHVNCKTENVIISHCAQNVVEIAVIYVKQHKNSIPELPDTEANS